MSGAAFTAHVRVMDTRISDLAGALTEAAAIATDGCRPIADDDAPAIATELLTGDRMPSWLQATPSDLVFELAKHQQYRWDPEAIAPGPKPHGGWVCACGALLSGPDADVSVPDGLAGVRAGDVWQARHQVAMLTAAALI